MGNTFKKSRLKASKKETCHYLASALSMAHKENYKIQLEMYKSEKNTEALIRELAQTNVKVLEEQLANVTGSHARNQSKETSTTPKDAEQCSPMPDSMSSSSVLPYPFNMNNWKMSDSLVAAIDDTETLPGRDIHVPSMLDSIRKHSLQQITVYEENDDLISKGSSTELNKYDDGQKCANMDTYIFGHYGAVV